MLPDGEQYSFLIFLAAATTDEEQRVRAMPFSDFVRLLGMRMARTILATPGKNLIKTR